MNPVPFGPVLRVLFLQRLVVKALSRVRLYVRRKGVPTNSTGMWCYPLVPDDLSNKPRATSICSDSRIRVAYRDSRPMSAWAFFTVSRGSTKDRSSHCCENTRFGGRLLGVRVRSCRTAQPHPDCEPWCRAAIRSQSTNQCSAHCWSRSRMRGSDHRNPLRYQCSRQ